MMPPTPAPPAILARLAAFVTPPPTLATTCTRIAAEFRRLAREAYDVGDQGRGDRLTARGLAWELAGATENLEEVRP